MNHATYLLTSLNQPLAYLNKKAVWLNKLYGITPFVLFIPLHAKFENKPATKSFNLKERLCNVKLKDIDASAKRHMSINWVPEQTKQLKNVG